MFELKTDVVEVEDTKAAELRELAELQLALVGGGGAVASLD